MKIHLIKYMIGVLFMTVAFACGNSAGSSGDVNGGDSGAGSPACPGVEAGDPGTFTETGSLTAPRSGQTVTLLNNCKVLIAGGKNDEAGELDSAELYNPATGTFTAVGSLRVQRERHTATLLPNGKVLILGGFWKAEAATDVAELYDPATETFAEIEDRMKTARGGHTATLLPNGKVLIVGGQKDGSEALDSAELFDPDKSGGSFSPLEQKLPTGPRFDHTATLLQNGKVLIVGGSNGSEFNHRVELYDPDSHEQGEFMHIADLATGPRSEHTATLLDGDKVLIIGGKKDIGGEPTEQVELYDPDSGEYGEFTHLGDLSTGPRRAHTTTLLGNGKILIVGGIRDAGTTVALEVELYDPLSPDQGFQHIGDLSDDGRHGHTAILLDSGLVLFVGGTNRHDEILETAEIYKP